MRARILAMVAALALPVLAVAKPPNVIVIVGDDMGYADVSMHGGRDVPTPNIDSIGSNGVRCTSGYVSAPYCSPTRAGLLTGRYQTRFGHEFNPAGGGNGLPVDQVTMADRMKSAGYRTGLVGKWHLGNTEAMKPPQRGFEHFYGFLGGSHGYFNDPKAAPIFRGTEKIDEKEYLTDAFGREAVAFIDANKSQRFFLYLAFNAVHTPMNADEPRLKKHAAIADLKRRTYVAMMDALDENIGKVLTKLKAENLTEDTLVFFFSDNGGPTMTGTATNASINTPLRGSKRTTLEGGIRVPFCVQWPAKIPKGKVYDQPVIQLDVLPTALAAAGIAVKPEWKLDGVDLVPYLTGEQKAVPHEVLCWRFGVQHAIRKGDWKMVCYDLATEGKKGVSAMKLYNLATDIGEATDLAAKEPQKFAELQKAWDFWDKDNVAARWGAGPAKVSE